MSSNDMRKIMETIDNVDSLNLVKTDKFPMFKSMQPVVEDDGMSAGYPNFEADYDAKVEEFENHLLHAINLLGDLRKMLSAAERAGIDVRQQTDFLRHHLKYSIEELQK